MIKVLSLSVLFCCTLTAQSQPNIDFSIELPSKALGIDQNIQVYLPDSYEDETKSYPVLYVLDGQWFFLNGVAIMETLRGETLMPEMIIIGVDYQSRAVHDSIHFDHWNAVSEYIQTELVPFIDNNYRTNSEKVVFGWENPSFMVCEFLFQENPMFSGFIASNGGYANDAMLNEFAEYDGNDKYLYIANSSKDIYTVRHSNGLAQKLEETAPKNLKWKYELSNNEIHESQAYASLYRGLRFYYHNYGSKVFGSTEEFRQEGGMEALVEYFQERGERFDLDPEIDQSTKNSLIWLAWNQDDYPAFERFMTEFKDVLSTPRYASAYWQNRLAQFYLKNNNAEEAIKFFQAGLQQYPDEEYLAMMNAGIGQGYEILKQKSKARTYYKQAIKEAKKSNDEKLDEYKRLLEDLE